MALEVGLGVEVASELDQCVAIVVAFFVEDAIDAALDEALDGIEEQRGDGDGADQPPSAEAGQSGVNDLGGDADTAK